MGEDNIVPRISVTRDNRKCEKGTFLYSPNDQKQCQRGAILYRSENQKQAGMWGAFLFAMLLPKNKQECERVAIFQSLLSNSSEGPCWGHPHEGTKNIAGMFPGIRTYIFHRSGNQAP